MGILLQHGATVDAVTKDSYTALHIAAKEGQEEVASLLLDHQASLTATTKVLVPPATAVQVALPYASLSLSLSRLCRRDSRHSTCLRSMATSKSLASCWRGKRLSTHRER